MQLPKLIDSKCKIPFLKVFIYSPKNSDKLHYTYIYIFYIYILDTHTRAVCHFEDWVHELLEIHLGQSCKLWPGRPIVVLACVHNISKLETYLDWHTFPVCHNPLDSLL